MNLNVKRSWSLKTKLTSLISAILVISIWSLTFYASRVLHQEIKNLAGEQQFSAASFIAAGINQELATRLKILEIVSSEIMPSMLKDTASLQAHIEQRPFLQVLFNGGVFITGMDGTAVADVPLSAERIGVNYMDRTSVSVPLKEGKSMIGQPAMGKKLGAPIFSISVPIRDTRGTVIGVLLGTINLNLPSFLDEITNKHYGKTGGYLLVAPQYEVVVTATDKRRIMTPTSRPGSIPLLDRFRQGYEGSGILVNPLGVEVLASAKGIPVAGWYIVAALPTSEAFAPIYKMQVNILLVAILLTLIAAGLTWWILRGLLAPMLSTIEILSNITNSRRHLHPLPIVREDEIGKLIDSFNKLLTFLSKGEEDLQNSKSNLEKLVVERTKALRESELLYRGIGESIDYGVWVCAPDGHNTYASESFLKMVGITQEQCSNFGWGDVLHPDDAERTIAAWQECVRTGGNWDIEHRFRGAEGKWHYVLARGVPIKNEYGEITKWAGINLDIDQIKQAEEQVKAALAEKEVMLKEIHHRVKNNLQVISSLVSMQADNLTDERAIEELNDVCDRVRSMALIHEKLYQTDDMAQLNFADYSVSLLHALWNSHDVLAENVKLNLELAPMTMPIEAAVPCGLILNELAGNALKHAFPNGSDGEVTVGLEHDSVTDTACLWVRDNGVGLIPGLDWRKSCSLGLRLVQILAGQLHGTVETGTAPGTEFRVTFPLITGSHHE